MSIDRLLIISIFLMISIIIKTIFEKKNKEKVLHESKVSILFKIMSGWLCLIIVQVLMNLWLVVVHGKSIMILYDLNYIFFIVLIITLWSSLTIKNVVITNEGLYHKIGINKLKKVCNLDEILSVQYNIENKIMLLLKNGKKRTVYYGGDVIEKQKIEKVICYIIEKLNE